MREFENFSINRFAYEPVADPVRALDFDFSADVPDRKVSLDVQPKRNGVTHAWVFWYKLWLDEDDEFDSGPFVIGSHWGQAVQIVQEPIVVVENRSLAVQIDQSQTHIRFSHPGATT